MGITVWTVCVGDKYTDDDVRLIDVQVSRHLQDYEFKCLSDRKIEGVDCVPVKHNWPGWWSKLELFEHAKSGMNLYLDLDVVVTGSLDGLLSKRLSMPANWAQSGHGGCQSSVMSWGLDYSYIPAAFDPKLLSQPEMGNYGWYGATKLWGDQEFITDLVGTPGHKKTVKAMSGVYSYKYHCRGKSLPGDAAVVCFHGTPKPADVNDEWVRKARSYTATAA